MQNIQNLWSVKPHSFRDIPEVSAPGVHAASFALLKSRISDFTSKNCLDLATGNGAFAARLLDAGAKSLRTVDLDPERCREGRTKPERLDLNQDWASETFHIITALEIIEHLDHPRHFVRECKKSLAPGGVLLLSTPNIEDWRSRLNFLLKGYPRYFSREDYVTQRHINPLSDFHLRQIFDEAGLEVLASTTAGDCWGPLKRIVFSPLLFLRMLMKGHTKVGEVNIYLIASKAGPHA